MTIKEIYEYAKANNVENFEIEGYDKDGNGYRINMLFIYYDAKNPTIPTDVFFQVEKSDIDISVPMQFIKNEVL